jgi:biotin synthase
LDAASQRIYRMSKTGSWDRQLRLLRRSAAAFPGHIGTHLIVGLGESEAEMVATLQQMVDWQVTVGLFSFTPIDGTAMGRHPPPDLSTYRRVQVARHLLVSRQCRVDSMRFRANGEIADFGVELAVLRDLLSEGVAFRTAGCTGCNRPYYNEHPGRTMYNYPRPLTQEEVYQAIRVALRGTVQATIPMNTHAA